MGAEDRQECTGTLEQGALLSQLECCDAGRLHAFLESLLLQVMSLLLVPWRIIYMEVLHRSHSRLEKPPFSEQWVDRHSLHCPAGRVVVLDESPRQSRAVSASMKPLWLKTAWTAH